MKYFLDFDRTLFDTDAFKDYLAVREHDAGITGEPEVDVGIALNERVKSGTLSFAPGELVRFIYPDVAEFLQRLGSDVVLITFGNAALQKAKVENALAECMPSAALYTGDALKAEYLASWPSYSGEEAVFADDRPHELEAMTAAFPLIRAYEMRRDGAAGDGRWPVVRALVELP